MIKILLIILCCYAFVSIVMFFIFVILNWEEFADRFDEDERKMAIIIMITLSPIILIAALVTTSAKPVLNRTIWRDNTKKVTEETVSASLSKALKNYNRYFEKK